ncbi:hypothetical protein MHJ82_09540 [Corynebacterium afermentans]|uniref:hypothetical protein n=1 Tax=Corynebacterium afermentans TaxID=38286 RepID=UPI0025736E4B|nr:hypothetical protein [Corynebacterium afermentans]MCG7274556.1 hypothetical protein [Corynebacterium afermentans]
MSSTSFNSRHTALVAEILGAREPRVLEALDSLTELLGLSVPADNSSPRATDLEATCALVNLVELERSAARDWQLNRSLTDISEKAVSWLPGHFESHPEDRKPYSDFIQLRCDSGFPWHAAQPAASALALLYNFSPFQDTGATVASKRLRNFSRTFDVVACSFLHKKKQDPTIERIAEPYVASKYFLPLPASWASWEPFKAFAVRASEVANSMHTTANYEMVYSRAMWAPSIYAGFLFKQRNPEVEWVAEFSDPLSLDVEGLPRGTAVPADEVSSTMIEALTLEYPDLDVSSLSVFSLAETLAYAFADRIIFTNTNQKLTMLEHVGSAALAERVDRIGEVSNHPTLPRSYYEMERTSLEPDPAKLNLGYFGEFYSSRSIREVTAAMRTLPPKIAEKVHLHVFTNYIPASEGNRRPRNFSKKQFDELVQRAYDGVGAKGVESQVSFNASLPYLKFLATTEKLDYLIVNDAVSGDHHSVNPYLPSKWSDYAGSSAKSWGFVEDGSILSQKPVDVKTPVGDAYEAREMLWNMLLQKFPELDEEV